MKSKQRPTTRSERRAKDPVTLPVKFTPRWLDSADQRQAIVKSIRRRIDQIKEETGCNTLIREMLIEELVFLSVWNASNRLRYLETGEYDAGTAIQALNALSGLASKLGIDRKEVIGPSLQSILEEARAKK